MKRDTKPKWKQRVGELKVMWWERYMTYLAKPMTVYNFLMLSFVSIMVGLSTWLIFIAVIGLILITIIVAKKDRKVLQQEQMFITSNNPILMAMRHDITEIKAMLEKSQQG